MLLGDTSYTTTSLNLCLGWLLLGSWSARDHMRTKPANLSTLRNFQQGKLCSFSKKGQHAMPTGDYNCKSFHYQCQHIKLLIRTRKKPQLVIRGLDTIPCIWRGFTWASAATSTDIASSCSSFLFPPPYKVRGEKKVGEGCLFSAERPPTRSAYEVSGCECHLPNFPLCC